jgi:uncharacterized protein YjeT (DUF2065 family)
MNWSDLLAAFALYLVLEGILPFASPRALKLTMLAFANLADKRLRIMGLISMAAGLLLLYAVRS